MLPHIVRNMLNIKENTIPIGDMMEGIYAHQFVQQLSPVYII